MIEMDILDSTIIVAVIAGLCSVLGSFLSNRTYKKKSEQERDIEEVRREMELKADLDSIKSEIADMKKKLDVHNGYAEKFNDIAVTIAEILTEIKNLKENK